MQAVGITVSSSAAVAAAIGSASDVVLGAYILPDRAMLGTLIAAARRGAHVAVTLQADPYDDPGGEMARANAWAARTLREAGATVALVSRTVRPFHLKAAICDGIAYLDDRNWGRDGVVLRDDDAGDVNRVRDALAGRGGGEGGDLAFGKARVLREEAALIDAAGDDEVVVASEAFGTGPVADAIERRAARGAPTSVIVDRRELDARRRALLGSFARLGVRVNTSVADEKYVLAGDAVWVGSANATYADGQFADQTEWGLIARDPALVTALRRELARDAAAASAAGSARIACAARA